MTDKDDEATCPECGDDLFIKPVQAEHVGLIGCGVCQTDIRWESPFGTRNWSFTNIESPTAEEE